MFDPEIAFDGKMSAECGYVPDIVYPKAKCHEQELKYSIQSNSLIPYENIRHNIASKPHRKIDMRSYFASPDAIITMNLDTKTRELAKAGFSLRVRFALSGDTMNDVSRIDMCAKTRLLPGVIPLHEQTRYHRSPPRTGQTGLLRHAQQRRQGG